MSRCHQILFGLSVVALCWFGMMAIHELGHVMGAVTTGARVQRVVLHPLTISRTDVSPNPHPGWVVWLGPIAGCLVPLTLAAITPARFLALGLTVRFFAGFCLIANGAYISLGSFDRVGDCGEMLRTGTPLWTMLLFGAAAMTGGFYLWHSLGSLREFLVHPQRVTALMAWAAFALATTVLGAGVIFSAR